MPSIKFHRIENCRNASRITLYLGKFSHSCVFNLYLEMLVTISNVFKMYVFLKGLIPKIRNLEMSLVAVRTLVTDESREVKS